MLAIAVVSWNTRAPLARCLASMRGYDVTVVDNASEDGSARMVRDEFPGVRLIEAGANLGYGPAVNLALRETRAPWVVAANADVALAPGALEELVAAGARHPRAGALAPRLLTPDGATQHSVHPFPTLPRLAAFNLGLGAIVGDRLGLEGHFDHERERRVDWAHGALLMLRREAWEAVGGFDPGQWMYAEDLDIGWRLARAGWSTVYVPGARVEHAVASATTQAFGDAREARAQARAYAWMLRRRGLARTRAAAAINIAGAGARAVLARDPARRAAARRWARAHRSGLMSERELRELR